MTGLPVLAKRQALLLEIGRIMDSIKSIALIESQQSRSSLDSQRSGLKVMGAAVAEFIGAYYPGGLAFAESPRIVLMIGSERGFCGDFNARLVEELMAAERGMQGAACQLITVGYRLSSKLRDDARALRSIAGASVAAEIDSTLTAVLDVLTELDPAEGFASVWVLYHDEAARGTQMQPLLAGLWGGGGAQVQSSQLPAPPVPSPVPLIQLPAPQLLQELIAEYVYARLHMLLTLSFVAENEQRIQHLRNALDRIEEQADALIRQRNQLRQEQITEELEIILLNGMDEVDE